MTSLKEINKTYHITTFGCQMNAHDSEKLAGILTGLGYRPAESPDQAGLVVFNTCCIRENAENRVLGNLGYFKHQKQSNPDMLIAVGGCMPQLEKARNRILATGTVDILFGTYNLGRFGELLEKALERKSKVVEVWDGPNGDIDWLDAARESPYRAGVNIMYGCDNFCSYCIVPYVRGRERSRPASDILHEIEELVKSGVMDIMLLGQNVNSYGQKPEKGETDFHELLDMAAKLSPAPPRLRFMTSHPKDMSPELVNVIAGNDNVSKHIHLPVQSGSSRVLKQMNRRYDRDGYLALLESIRRRLPDVSVTTDIIVGFPGETEEDFEETLSLVRQAKFNGAFTFLYSRREGTKAASMEDQVPSGIANERFQRLLDTINPICFEINKAMEHKTFKVLAEKEKDGVYTGRTDNNTLTHFTGPEGLLGKIVPVVITEAKSFFVSGRAQVPKDDSLTCRP